MWFVILTEKSTAAPDDTHMIACVSKILLAIKMKACTVAGRGEKVVLIRTAAAAAAVLVGTAAAAAALLQQQQYEYSYYMMTFLLRAIRK